MKFNRRELLRLIGLLAIGWVAILLLLARWQRTSPPGRASGTWERELMHYPGTEAVPEQTSQNLGLRKYWFHLSQDYPSRSVYYFYRDRLQADGWRPLATGEPQWVRQITKGDATDVFESIWISPDNLFQIEVEMMSVVKLSREGGAIVGEAREPGIEVFVTLRRALHPGIFMQRPPGRAPQREIEAPGL